MNDTITSNISDNLYKGVYDHEPAYIGNFDGQPLYYTTLSMVTTLKGNKIRLEHKLLVLLDEYENEWTSIPYVTETTVSEEWTRYRYYGLFNVKNYSIELITFLHNKQIIGAYTGNDIRVGDVVYDVRELTI